MAIVAQIIDGKVVANYTDGKADKKTGSDSLNKDAFLQILAAEMQYQDPLEPSSNTEWVSQMSSFSQIESLQTVSDSISEQGASNLVGKRVILEDTDSAGNTKYITGKVQCTEKVNGKIYLSINDNLYDYDKLYSVVDEDYYNEVINKKQ